MTMLLALGIGLFVAIALSLALFAFLGRSAAKRKPEHLSDRAGDVEFRAQNEARRG